MVYSLHKVPDGVSPKSSPWYYSHCRPLVLQNHANIKLRKRVILLSKTIVRTQESLLSENGLEYCQRLHNTEENTFQSV